MKCTGHVKHHTDTDARHIRTILVLLPCSPRLRRCRPPLCHDASPAGKARSRLSLPPCHQPSRVIILLYADVGCKSAAQRDSLPARQYAFSRPYAASRTAECPVDAIEVELSTNTAHEQRRTTEIFRREQCHGAIFRRLYATSRPPPEAAAAREPASGRLSRNPATAQAAPPHSPFNIFVDIAVPIGELPCAPPFLFCRSQLL